MDDELSVSGVASDVPIDTQPKIHVYEYVSKWDATGPEADDHRSIIRGQVQDMAAGNNMRVVNIDEPDLVERDMPDHDPEILRLTWNVEQA